MMKIDRLKRALRGEEVDRFPIVGGWSLGVQQMTTWSGLSEQEYLRDPERGMIAANRQLDVDGMVQAYIIPRDPNAIRDGAVQEENFADVEPERVVELAQAEPDTERGVQASYDIVQFECSAREVMQQRQKLLGDIALIPTWWQQVPNFGLYSQIGYSAFFQACALYPEEIEKVWWASAVRARQRSVVLAKLIHELDLLPIVLTGHDMCDARGPMVSPDFLRQRYWPHCRYCIAPLVDAGICVVHHCDGNIMPLIPDMLDVGFGGFQGFQYEFGVDPFVIARMKKLFFMAGLSVTRTLPFGTTEDVEQEVDYILDYTGGTSACLFTSNVTTVETPPGNLVAAYRHARQADPNHRNCTPRPWPLGSNNVGGSKKDL